MPSTTIICLHVPAICACVCFDMPLLRLLPCIHTHSCAPVLSDWTAWWCCQQSFSYFSAVCWLQGRDFWLCLHVINYRPLVLLLWLVCCSEVMHGIGIFVSGVLLPRPCYCTIRLISVRPTRWPSAAWISDVCRRRVGATGMVGQPAHIWPWVGGSGRCWYLAGSRYICK